MKKNLPVSKNANNQLSQEEKGLQKIAKQAEKEIKKGIEKPTASTGTPIKDLNGGAKKNATMSNIGGGSKETGGGGMDKGLETLLTYTAAKAKLEGIQCAKNSNNKKLK